VRGLLDAAGRFLEKDVETVREVAARQGIDLGLLGEVAARMGAST
jgi:hypothetical protein